jgi:hypothetical protein
MKVLVCGGRYFADAATLDKALDGLLPHGVTMIIHGGAKGADFMAGCWAERRGVHCATVPALWHVHGKAAGMIRNRAMLTLQPDMVVAFPGGAGTAGMVNEARRAGVVVWEPMP